MSAWVKQRSEQIEKYGAERAPWYVIWNEPNGTRRKKSCGTGRTGKRDAKRLAERIKAELLTGTYDRQAHKKWDEFRSEHDSRILQGMKPRSADQTRYSLNHFERLCKPRYVGQITTATMDKFIAARREQRGIKRVSKVSPATTNRDLGNLRAVFRIAVEWNYLVARLFKFSESAVPTKASMRGSTEPPLPLSFRVLRPSLCCELCLF